MNRVVLAAVTSLLMLFLPGANAEPADEERTPKAELRHLTSPTVIEWLQLRFQAAGIKAGMGTPGDHYGDVKAEISKRREDAKAAYTSVLALVKGNTEATKLLKEFYALWLAALDGVEPQAFESKFAYKARQSETVARLNEAWYRFDVEAGLP